jgi:hypothetical protein
LPISHAPDGDRIEHYPELSLTTPLKRLRVAPTTFDNTSFGPYGPFINNGSKDKEKGTDTPNPGPFGEDYKIPANGNNLNPKRPKGPKGSKGPMCICGLRPVTVRVTGEGVVNGLYCDECASWLEGGETVITPLQSEEMDNVR